MNFIPKHYGVRCIYIYIYRRSLHGTDNEVTEAEDACSQKLLMKIFRIAR